MILINFYLTNDMANIMDLKTVRNKPSRNGFDLSTKRNFTAKCGELLPIWSQEVIPGDNFTIDLKSFTRTAPVNTAAFARIREYWDFYFVPYHTLWNRANEVLSKMDFNQQHATNLSTIPDKFSGELPYITQSQITEYLKTLNKSTGSTGTRFNFFGYDRAQLTVKLLEYLQYGNYEGALRDTPVGNCYNLDLNIMGLLAYQKIYSDYFRNQQWEKPNPSTFNCDYMDGSTSMNVAVPTSDSDSFFTNYNFFDLRYCDWQKDLYHGLLPQAQYGDTAVVPLFLDDGLFSADARGSFSIDGKTMSVSSSSSLNASSDYSVYGHMDSASLGVLKFQKGSDPDSNDPLVRFNTGSIPVSVSKSSLNAAVNTFASGLSVLALRQYECLQRWREIAQCGDQDFRGITSRIWGVNVPAVASDKCMYLGGTASSLDINEVVNNNITDEFGAAIAGKGIGTSSGKITFDADKFGNQYGIVMCIYHCVPLVDYTVNYVSPVFTRINAEDFADPTFDRIGMEAVTSSHIFDFPAEKSQTPFIMGYAPRYISYKTDIDLSFGAFKRSLKNWVLNYGHDSLFDAMFSSDRTENPDIPAEGDQPSSPDMGSMTYVFFKVNPNLVDPIFALKADSSMDTDQFWCSSFFDVKAVRNLDTDGLPY